jgi:hypothetical protein
MPESEGYWEECTESGNGWDTAYPTRLIRLSSIRLSTPY